MRTILAAIAGYLVFAVSAVAFFQLSNRAPHAATTIAFAFLATLYGVAFAAVSGWLAQRIARRGDLLAPLLVAGIIALGAAISLATTWREAAHWSQWSALFLMAPAALAGGAAGRVSPERTS